MRVINVNINHSYDANSRGTNVAAVFYYGYAVFIQCVIFILRNILRLYCVILRYTAFILRFLHP
jgi:hypothetical protein